MSELDSNVPVGFRQIPNFPRYAIDENGTVLSICRHSRWPDKKWINASRINPTVHKGYHVVFLRNEEGKRRFYVHALVLTMFVGPRPDGLQCRHLDGCRTNNHVSNLAWGTGVENQHDRILHGTSNEGEMCGTSKLTTTDVLEIRRRRANGDVLHVLADDFHVSKFAIWAIEKRLTWKHI